MKNNPSKAEIKILLISGPTASGKTGLALRLAKQFNGEIISADSRQVYQGMDIVTGKDIPKDSKFISQSVETCHGKSLHMENNKTYNLGFYNFNSIPVYGLDLVKPDESFDVSDFVKISRFLISHIQKKSKLPIIVGGTSFWLKNLISPAQTIGIPVNPKLRKDLEKLSLKDLQEKLKKLNPDKFSSLNNSDANNPRRLIRAIEVSSSKNVQTTHRGVSIIPGKETRQWHVSTKIPFNSLWLSLNPNLKNLEEKIEKRVEQRVANGAIEETKKLASQFNWNLPSMSAIGYKDLKLFLSGEKNLEEAKKLWTLHENQYAKRQLTFLAKISDIKNYDLQAKDSYDKIKTEVKKFLKN